MGFEDAFDSGESFVIDGFEWVGGEAFAVEKFEFRVFCGVAEECVFDHDFHVGFVSKS